jgi:putative aldouronate transport system permease protein
MTGNKLLLISRRWNFIFLLILLAGVVCVAAPMALIVIISFSSEASIAAKGFSFFPSGWTLRAYSYLFRTGNQLFQSYIITIFYTAVGTVISLIVMTLFAYVLAQRRFVFQRALTWYLFVTMLFSGGLIPSYILIVKYLHMRDTVWVFLLGGVVNAWYVIILRTFIYSTIPESLFESARIDGAGHFRIYFRILLPLFKPGVATIGLFNLVGRWNDWFTGLLYIDNPKLVPLQTMLYRLQSELDFLKNNSRMANTPDGLRILSSLPDENLRMACTLVVILPILFAYPFFQRYFVRGLTLGSIKE